MVVVNPAHVKQTKELDDNSPTKNDFKDARVISRLIEGGRYSEPIYRKVYTRENMRTVLMFLSFR